MQTMPCVFLGHGSPLTLLDDPAAVQGWKEVARSLPKPETILVLSAHWYTHGTFVCTNPAPHTIHDFYGFPRELYQIVYTPPGAVGLAERVKKILGCSCEPDPSYGLDHGAWTVLKSMYPGADIPVAQLSINGDLSFSDAYEIGRKLQVLRNENVLLLGSGGIVHNLRETTEEEEEFPWAKQFDDFVTAAVERRDFQTIIRIRETEPKGYIRSVPTPEHFLPLLYILGSVGDSDSLSVFNRKGQLGSTTLTGYLFSER